MMPQFLRRPAVRVINNAFKILPGSIMQFDVTFFFNNVALALFVGPHLRFAFLQQFRVDARFLQLRDAHVPIKDRIEISHVRRFDHPQQSFRSGPARQRVAFVPRDRSNLLFGQFGVRKSVQVLFDGRACGPSTSAVNARVTRYKPMLGWWNDATLAGCRIGDDRLFRWRKVRWIGVFGHT